MEDILSAAEEILGTVVLVERNRDWATFWCPFHNDASREGRGGHPNFGVHLSDGYWKCLRCGAKGGSLNALRIELGQDWKPPVSESKPTRPAKPPSQVGMLDEAMSEARCLPGHILQGAIYCPIRRWYMDSDTEIPFQEATARSSKPQHNRCWCAVLTALDCSPCWAMRPEVSSILSLLGEKIGFTVGCSPCCWFWRPFRNTRLT